MAAASSSSGAASSSSGSAIGVSAAEEAGKGDELTEKILALQKQQKELLDQKKALAKRFAQCEKTENAVDQAHPPAE